MRKTSTPASNRARMRSGEDEAGPRVATILVLRRRLILIRKRLGEGQMIAGVDLEKAAPVEAAFGAAAPSDDGELLGGADAEALAAVPGADGPVRCVEVVIARDELAGDQFGAFFGLDMPPAFADPAGAVEAADGGPDGARALVADVQSRLGGAGGGEQEGEG